MHAWIFRHRKRLSAVFGMVTGEEPVSAETPETPEPEAHRPISQAPRSNNRLGIPPGSFARRGRYVVFAPMTRRRTR
jgi:hypothetical protein